MEEITSPQHNSYSYQQQQQQQLPLNNKLLEEILSSPCLINNQSAVQRHKEQQQLKQHNNTDDNTYYSSYGMPTVLHEGIYHNTYGNDIYAQSNKNSLWNRASNTIKPYHAFDTLSSMKKQYHEIQTQNDDIISPYYHRKKLNVYDLVDYNDAPVNDSCWKECIIPKDNFNNEHNYSSFNRMINIPTATTSKNCNAALLGLESVYEAKNTNRNVITNENPNEFGNCLSSTRTSYNNDNNMIVTFGEGDRIVQKYIHFPMDDYNENSLGGTNNNATAKIQLQSRIKQITPMNHNGIFMVRTDDHCTLLHQYNNTTIGLQEIQRIYTKQQKSSHITSNEKTNSFSISYTNSNSLHEVIYSNNTIQIQPITFASLSHVNIIEYANDHPRLLYASALTSKEERYIPISNVCNYESNLYLLDYRCPTSNPISLLDVSLVESFESKTFFITNIKPHPVHSHGVFVSSSSNKIYEIDNRMPSRYIDYCLSQTLDGKIGVRTGGDLLHYIVPDKDEYCTGNRDNGILVAQSKQPSSFGMRLYYNISPSSKSTTTSLFETKPFELPRNNIKNTSISTMKQVQIISSPDASLQTFIVGITSFYTNSSKFHDSNISDDDDYFDDDTNVLCILMLTNVGDIYAHTLLPRQQQDTSIVKTKTGQKRIPIPKSYQHQHNNNKKASHEKNTSKFYLYYSLSNKEPIPYHAKHKYNNTAITTHDSKRHKNKNKHLKKISCNYSFPLPSWKEHPENGNTQKEEYYDYLLEKHKQRYKKRRQKYSLDDGNEPCSLFQKSLYCLDDNDTTINNGERLLHQDDEDGSLNQDDEEHYDDDEEQHGNEEDHDEEEDMIVVEEDKTTIICVGQYHTCSNTGAKLSLPLKNTATTTNTQNNNTIKSAVSSLLPPIAISKEHTTIIHHPISNTAITTLSPNNNNNTTSAINPHNQEENINNPIIEIPQDGILQDPIEISDNNNQTKVLPEEMDEYQNLKTDVLYENIINYTINWNDIELNIDSKCIKQENDDEDDSCRVVEEEDPYHYDDNVKHEMMDSTETPDFIQSTTTNMDDDDFY